MNFDELPHEEQDRILREQRDAQFEQSFREIAAKNNCLVSKNANGTWAVDYADILAPARSFDPELAKQIKEMSNSLRDSFSIMSPPTPIELRDVEQEIVEVLQAEIWYEIEKETGMTKEKHDQQIVDQLVAFMKETKGN